MELTYEELVYLLGGVIIGMIVTDFFLIWLRNR